MPKAKPDNDLQAMDPLPNKTPKRTPRARGAVMTDAVQTEICARMAEGETLSSVCRDPNLPHKSTVLRWAVENAAWRDRYAKARELMHDEWADQIITISDDGTTDYVLKTGRNGHEYMAVDQDHIQRSRLRVDSRKWLLSKLRPGEYGDKVEQVQSGSVTVRHDITQLSEREKMRRFALFMVEDQRAKPGATIEGDSKPVTPASKQAQPDDAGDSAA